MSAHRRYRVAAAASTVAGLALFALLVYQTGPGAIAASIRACGSAFALLVLLSGARHLLRTWAWRLCIDPSHRSVAFVDLFNIRLAAEAVTDLTFAGPLLGESAKALAVSQRIPATNSLSSIVIENLVYSLSVVLFIMSGAVVFLAGVALPHRTQLAVLLVGVGMLVPILAIQAAITRRFLILTTLFDRLGVAGIRVAAIDRRRDKIRGFEQQVIDFYTGRRGLFFGVLVLEMLTSVTGVLEAYVILAVTTDHTSLFAAYVIESVNRAVNAIFPFLPLRLGVDEGGAALVFKALGYTTAAGVSLAVIRKIRSIFWIGVGLVCMARYAIWKGGAARPSLEVADGDETAHRQR